MNMASKTFRLSPLAPSFMEAVLSNPSAVNCLAFWEAIGGDKWGADVLTEISDGTIDGDAELRVLLEPCVHGAWGESVIQGAIQVLRETRGENDTTEEFLQEFVGDFNHRFNSWQLELKPEHSC